MDLFRVNEHDLKRFYDQKYDDRYMLKHDELDLKIVKDVLERIPHQIDTILDFGCGQGACVDLLTTVFPRAEITGVDISETAIKKAAEKFCEHRFVFFN